MNITRLILIRHTQPRPEESDGRCYGALDIDLSARGHRHARHIARTLDAITLDAVYTSPLLRARQTAEPLAHTHGLQIVIDDNLREIHFGDLEGMTYEEIEQTHPELYRRWMDTPTAVEFPGGESYAKLQQRAIAAYEAIRAQHPGETVAAITHAGIVRAILADCLSIPSSSIFRLDQHHGALNIIDWTDTEPSVRLVNGQATMTARKRGGFFLNDSPASAWHE